MGRFADGASTVADPFRVSVTPPVALRIARCVGVFLRNESKLGHWSSSSRAEVTGAAAGGVWRRLTVRCNTEGHVLVVMQASPAGASGGTAEIAEEVSLLTVLNDSHCTLLVSHGIRLPCFCHVSIPAAPQHRLSSPQSPHPTLDKLRNPMVPTALPLHMTELF